MGAGTAGLLLIGALGLAAQHGAPARPPPPQPAQPAATWTPPVLHTTAMFTIMRHAEAVLWPHPFAETAPARVAQSYERAYTMPPLFDTSRRAFEWDHDPWAVNVIGHGLLGSELYLRARTCHFGWAGSLAFAAGASAIWEYVFEASGVRPSALDLVYTPLAGLLLGEARYLAYRGAQSMRARGARGVLSALVDPFGELERRAMGSPC